MGGEARDIYKDVAITKRTKNTKSEIISLEKFPWGKIEVKSCCHFAMCSTVFMGHTDIYSDMNGQPGIFPCASVFIPNTIPMVPANRKIPTSAIASAGNMVRVCEGNFIVGIIPRPSPTMQYHDQKIQARASFLAHNSFLFL